MLVTPSPYPSKVWEKIRACGDSVEALLTKNGIQLTLGGEPTFVPIDPEGAEWNTAAIGPTKLDYARRFARLLVQESYPGAAIIESTGKLYPGETHPRWAVTVQSRADGKPLWRDIQRLRGDTRPGDHILKQAETLLHRIAQKLLVAEQGILPYAEANAPESLTGYVLPLDHDDQKWISDDWTPTLKAPKVVLLPGDSLAGLRLPLETLGDKSLKRALTVELRNGTLTLFLPPLSLAAYLQLLPAIESCLDKLSLRDVVLAGYTPQADPSILTVGFTSDPGVLEVNLASSANWVEYDKQLNQIYTIAAKIGLCPRKLNLNGRESGTGGGAHLVFGGPVGETSPFFTSPALLPSVIRYFQHHPALSYAFTGQYMGPSSQAPRVDESTSDALYELEIACAGAEQFGSANNLALFDLLFRDLLMDRSGNTHRAEISIDKLWNATAPTGRLGLVEFRAFESNPACAAQSVTALFVRAIVARLTIDPFRAAFIRWGGELHDRFFLPAFVWQDLCAICADLRAHGIPFDQEWLRPTWEFRFPKLGEMPIKLPPTQPGEEPMDFKISFRQALEAWPLLGDQSTVSGDATRSVDSSADRIEASLENPSALRRGLLLVNGFPCEFSPVEDSPFEQGGKRLGVSAAGVRFRAFYLHPALHPHVPVHSPLLIEWVDRATFTVLAAARWHVWNPRSVPYTSRPQTAADARTRFAERWESWPHTVGQPRFIQRVEFPQESRFTLDLRRYPAQTRS